MGLKSGSRDSGLEEEDQENEAGERASSETQPGVGDDDSAPTEEATERHPTSTKEHSSDSRPARSSIPYKLRREKVNEGREQVPYFLREEIIDAEDELQERLEEMLGETVYKSDYREAAMVVAQRNPDLIADVLREWGYDLTK